MGTILFSCGFGSGGTDLTKNILNAHPKIRISSEFINLPNILERGYNKDTVFSDMNEVAEFRRLLQELHFGTDFDGIDYEHSLKLLASDFAEKGSLTLEDGLRRCLSTKDATVWGTKILAWQIGIMSELFPKAKFLIVTRDVRDICLSWKTKWGKDMTWCSAKWAEGMRKGLEFVSGMESGKCLIIKFEDLLSATEKMCREICEFVRLPFSDRMVTYHLFTDHWDGKINYGRPIISDNKEKWRQQLSKAEVTRIEEIAFDTMKLLGYTPEFASESKPLSRYEKARGVVRDSWAMVFVGNRAHSRNTFAGRLRKASRAFRGRMLHASQKRRQLKDSRNSGA
jgi:hypothetical protein